MRYNSLKIGILEILLTIVCNACISTPQDAMEHYELVGPKEYAENMVDWTSFEVMPLVFNDSIFPKIVKELSFKELAEISEIVKNHSCYSNFTQVILPEDKMIETFKSLEPLEGAKFYLLHYKTFKGLPEVFKNNVLPTYLSKVSFKDGINMYDLLKPAGLGTEVSSYPFQPEAVLEYFQSEEMMDGVKAYARLHAMPVVDSVYTAYILPHVMDSHYVMLKEIAPYFKKTKYSSYVNDAIKDAKTEYLTKINEEITEYQNQAVEALDRIIIPSIEYELDSISKVEADKVTEKFMGGFLNFRKLALSFGRDEKKFKELWDKHVHGEKYDECVDKHITVFLDEIYAFQKEYYKEMTGRNRKKVVFEFMSEPITIKYPNDTKMIVNYIQSNKFGSLLNIAEWLPYVGDAVSLTREIKEALEDENENKLEDKAAFKIFCQQLILGQISEDYYTDFRERAITLIDKSYSNLYKDIAEKI